MLGRQYTDATQMEMGGRTRTKAAMLGLLVPLASIFCLTCYSIPTPPATSPRGKNHELQKGAGLVVTIEADKPQYKIDDAIQLRVFLTNTSSQPLYILVPLDWGSSASLSVWLYDSATGNEIEPKTIPDAIYPPPKGRDDFTKVLPNHILGLRDSFPLKELGIGDAPGKYDLQVEYHSPIPGDFILGLPIRSREQGSLRSNRITIQVSR